MIIPAALGALLGLVLTYFLPRHRGKALTILVVLVLALGIPAVREVLRAQNVLQGGQGPQPPGELQHKIMQSLEFTKNQFMPNYWISHGLIAAGKEGNETLSLTGAVFGAAVHERLFSADAGLVPGRVHLCADILASPCGPGAPPHAWIQLD